MDALYCPDCDMKLVGKTVEGKEIYCCTNCGKIFIKIDNHFRFAGQTSGNNSMREFFTVIDKED